MAQAKSHYPQALLSHFRNKCGSYNCNAGPAEPDFLTAEADRAILFSIVETMNEPMETDQEPFAISNWPNPDCRP